MKKKVNEVAFITAGVLPVPPVNGGAVENLIYNLLIENENKRKFNFDVYSIAFEKNVHYQSRFVYSNIVEIDNRKNMISKLKYYGVLSKVNKRYLAYPYLNNIIDRFLKEKIEYEYVVIENRAEFVLPISKATNSKIILHMHNDYLSHYSKENQKVLETVDKVIVVSDYIKNKIIQTWGIKYADKIYTLYNGIDITRFKPTPKREIEKAHYNIVFHGRVTQEKGIDVLLNSLLRSSINNIKLTIIGGSWYGTHNKNKFLKEVEELSKRLHIEVKFTGYIDYHEVPKYLDLADLVVLPSIWDDPFPLVVLEAMASNKIIISTNSGGIPEALEGVGIIIDKNKSKEETVKSLTEKIETVVQDYENHLILGDLARQRAIENFTIEKMYIKFSEILND